MAGLILGFICSVSVVLLLYREILMVRQEAHSVKEQLASYCHMVYVAGENLPKGSRLTEDRLYQEIRYSDLPQSEFITEEDFGMLTAIDIPAGTYLTRQMLYEERKSVREVLLSEVKCTEYLQSGDRIDVRIRYKNAEDYVVLSNKVISKPENGNEIWLDLTEEEILLLASAIADSGEYEATWLYAVRYPAYGESSATQGNYIANHDVLMLLEREKTEGESRTALEMRLLQGQ